MSDLPTAVHTERRLLAPPTDVFAAFQRPEVLAQWWGPKGFTNTFEQFDFTVGGRWLFTMHGPDGAHYLNESVFRAIVPDRQVVLEHIVTPWFRLTVTLSPCDDDQTHLEWVQEFEDPEVAARMRTLSQTANEQVLDRLEAVLRSENVFEKRGTHQSV